MNTYKIEIRPDGYYLDGIRIAEESKEMVGELVALPSPNGFHFSIPICMIKKWGIYEIQTEGRFEQKCQHRGIHNSTCIYNWIFHPSDQATKQENMKCEICGDEFDPSNLSSVIIHQHNGQEELAAQALGIKGKRVDQANGAEEKKNYNDVPLINWIKSHIRRAFRDAKEGRTYEDFIKSNEVIIECQIKNHDERLTPPQEGQEELISLIEYAFVAGRSKTSWEQFQKDHNMKLEDQKDLLRDLVDQYSIDPDFALERFLITRKPNQDKK